MQETPVGHYNILQLLHSTWRPASDGGNCRCNASRKCDPTMHLDKGLLNTVEVGAFLCIP